MKDDNKRNENEIQKMNNFLECFSCETEDELKQCFDKCGFWKTEKEMKEVYEKVSKEKDVLKKEKLLSCSLYEGKNKIGGICGKDLFSCLSFFIGNGNDIDEFKEHLFLRKCFVIYGKK